MKAKHQKTLKLIFQRPVSGSVRWADIESLFLALGADILEGKGARVCVRLLGHAVRWRCRHRVFSSTVKDDNAKVGLEKFKNGWNNGYCGYHDYRGLRDYGD